jgi:polyisoprenoid-binding protein YceI
MKRIIFLAAGLSLISIIAVAEPIKLNIVQGEVTFLSKATLESFEGKTTHITGYIIGDPINITSDIKSELIVDMSSFDTGNKIRNNHMNENHLQVKQYPTAKFTLNEVLGLSEVILIDSIPTKFKIKGTMEFHGVSKEILADVDAAWNVNTTALSVSASFDVSLIDFNIPRPQFLALKVADNQIITVKFIAQPLNQLETGSSK